MNAATVRALGAVGARVALALALVAPGPPAAVADADAGRFRMTSAKAFDEVMADLEFAITDHNYRITGRNRVGEGIAERDGVAFARATVVHFCSLTDARALLEAAPDFLIHMPCRVVAYEHAGVVVVEARLVPEDDPRTATMAARVNALLREIVRLAAQ